MNSMTIDIGHMNDHLLVERSLLQTLNTAYYSYVLKP